MAWFSKSAPQKDNKPQSELTSDLFGLLALMYLDLLHVRLPGEGEMSR